MWVCTDTVCSMASISHKQYCGSMEHLLPALTNPQYQAYNIAASHVDNNKYCYTRNVDKAIMRLTDWSVVIDIYIRENIST
jgi:hypothetical protein